MNIKDAFPFDMESMDYLIGDEFVLARVYDLKKFNSFDKIVFKEGGETNDSNYTWGIDNGKLRILKQNRTYGILDGLRINNGSLYFSGELNMEDGCTFGMHNSKTAKESEGVIKYYVSSHANYEKKTLRKLLSSMKKNGIEGSDIVVVVGGSEEERTEVVDEIEFRYVTYTGWHYTALISASEACEGDYCLLLPDTCEADRNFKRMVESIEIGMDYDAVFACGKGEFAIGLYSCDFLSRNKKFFDGLKDMSKKISLEVEASIFDVLRLHSVVNGEKNSGYSITYKKDVYGSGIERDVINLTDIGLIKYRANGNKNKSGWISEA